MSVGKFSKLSKNLARANEVKATANSNNPNKKYKILEAIELLKQMSYAKFDTTVEIAIKLGVDPKKTHVQGIAELPAGSGKKIRIAVLCTPELIQSALAAGADLADDSDKIIEDIKKGEINFDLFIAHTSKIGKFASVARTLGPKGLMPTTKLGTVTDDVVAAVKKAKQGQATFRTDKAGIVHAGAGKLSFTAEDLRQNILSLARAVIKAKPITAKGVYIKGVFLSTTMAPAVKISADDLVGK